MLICKCVGFPPPKKTMAVGRFSIVTLRVHVNLLIMHKYILLVFLIAVKVLGKWKPNITQPLHNDIIEHSWLIILLLFQNAPTHTDTFH